MRLTLRTMLAYLDNVLEPKDAEALGQKIEESDFASGLVERIKGVLRKVRMDAPKVDGKGMGNDANTVAEYLDSSLPQDRIGDFERVCLESDKHLSEVASCHQILTLVLGKPAEVPLELRERVYALGNPEQAAAGRRSSAAVGESRALPPPLTRTNGKPSVHPAPLEVPEYLRSSRNNSLAPALGILAALFLFVGFAVWASGVFKNDSPLRKLLSREKQIAAVTSEEGQPPAAAPAEAEPGKTEPEKTSAATAPAEDTRPASPSPRAEVATAEPPAAARPAVPDVDPNPEKTPTPAVAKAPEAPAAATPMPMPLPPVPAPISPEPTIAAVPAGRPPMASKTPPAAPKPEEKPLIEVGRYTSDGQVIATLNPNDGLWHRKPSREVVVAGERLVVLPAYRPQLTLPGIQVTFAGSGHVEMAPPSETGASRMLVDYGKLLIVAVGAAGPKIDLDLAGVQGTATLVDADSSLAIKVSRWFPPGTDPEAFTGMPVVEIFKTGGRVAWQAMGQERADIPAHHVVVYIGADPPELQGPFVSPDWIDDKSIAPIDRTAKVPLETMLDSNKPLNLALQETMQDRRVEVRALSARCLAAIDEFDPILRELGDSRQYSFWNAEVDALKQAISRSPQTAAHVAAAIERVRGADAKDLYRLLWGFSQEQLEKGAAAQLVRFLEHDQMDIRVLTFYNLVAITGAQEFYRPERPPAQVRAAIQNWKTRLAQGTIAYKQPPSPIEGYRPLAAAAMP